MLIFLSSSFNKLILFSYFVVNDQRGRFPAVSGPFGPIDGAVEFRRLDGEIDVLVLSPFSAGHGLNLQYSGSENIIFFGLIWSLDAYLQTIARICGGHRGVGRNNVIHHIVTENTYEDRVRHTLTTNARNQDEMKIALSMYVREVTDRLAA